MSAADPSSGNRDSARSEMSAGPRVFAAVGLLITVLTSGCAVVAVTDAVVTVAATVVKVGANVVGGTVDVARAGVRAVTGSDESKQ